MGQQDKKYLKIYQTIYKILYGFFNDYYSMDNGIYIIIVGKKWIRNEKVIYKEKGEKLVRRYGMKFFKTSSLKEILMLKKLLKV